MPASRRARAGFVPWPLAGLLALSACERQSIADAPPADATPPDSRWQRARDGGAPRGSEAEPAASLAALGYTAWDTPRADAEPPRGASVHDAARVAPGWNVTTDERARVLASDATGAVRREWVVPDRTQVETARVLVGGRVLALSVDEGLTLLEPNGALVWHLDLACHHDVTVRPGGAPGARTFAVATHTARPYRGRSVRFDEVRFVDEATGALVTLPDGAALDAFVLREAWLAPFAASGGVHPLDTPPATSAHRDTTYDYFHLNSLEWEVDERGHDSLLICLRNVDTVAVLDAVSGRLVWHADPRALDWPHMPRRLPSGDVLVFDNGRHRGWSRAVALDGDSRPTWSWEASPRAAFFSEVRGGAQRLANGNTLLTESERGHVFEVAPDGAIVWEFWNPERRDGRVRRIYRMERYAEAQFGE